MHIFEFKPTGPADGAPDLFHVTELSERLSGPEGYVLKKQVLARLDELLPRLNAKLRTGLARDAYREAEALIAALQAAHLFIENYPVRAPKLV